jgi:hypothetical protein
LAGQAQVQGSVWRWPGEGYVHALPFQRTIGVDW